MFLNGNTYKYRQKHRQENSLTPIVSLFIITEKLLFVIGNLLPLL